MLHISIRHLLLFKCVVTDYFSVNCQMVLLCIMAVKCLQIEQRAQGRIKWH